MVELKMDEVYVFKAAFKYRKGVWRRIEIEGGQTLADFDGIMREAFNHDTWDHLSELSLRGVCAGLVRSNRMAVEVVQKCE